MPISHIANSEGTKINPSTEGTSTSILGFISTVYDWFVSLFPWDLVSARQTARNITDQQIIPASNTIISYLPGIVPGLITPNDFFVQVSKGLVSGHSIVNKFGAGNLTTTLLPVSQDNTYPTPTSAVSLEFVSSSANDTAAGTGARQVTVIGLNSSWVEVTQTVTTNGVTPVALTTPLVRLYRWYVSSTGTYANESSGSHNGTLTIRVAGGGATWSTLTITPFPVGQSQIGIYTIPSGYTGYLLAKNVFTDTTKTADIYFFQRPNANDVTAPFSGGMRLFEREVGVSGGYQVMPPAPKGPLVGPCDVGFMGKVASGTSECSVEFQLLIVQN